MILGIDEVVRRDDGDTADLGVIQAADFLPTFYRCLLLGFVIRAEGCIVDDTLELVRFDFECRAGLELAQRTGPQSVCGAGKGDKGADDAAPAIVVVPLSIGLEAAKI